MCGRVAIAVIAFGALLAIVQCLRIHVDEPHYYGDIYHERSVYHQNGLQPKKKEKDEQDFSKIPGVPGVDYPIYHAVPDTSFHCGHVPIIPGMYANPETGCQAYHVCHDGREGHQGASFLCTNGTLFNQKLFGCDWWYNVDCHQAQNLWRLNADPELNPFTPKKKLEEVPKYQHHF
ncbi:uncharacterized protein LOC129810168 [Phlebotomus papatasi]|uniref:Uncharacterized protein n=1 Tax=Phlebotomus papatasi TaxID=29031 RepID=A0A1B0D967_PHLPP|nr:uncharacterized protein LOC129810168 [Phlebotomus papatasi]